MWQYTNYNELYHWGILGMKWGIRRYQNKDGTLTPAGRKRIKKLQDEYKTITRTKTNQKKLEDAEAKLKMEKKEDHGDKELKPGLPKLARDLTDDELKQQVNRLMLERSYLDLNKQIATLNPKQVSAAKKAVSYIGKSVILPAVTIAGKNALTAYLDKTAKKTLGLSVDTGSSLDGIKKQHLALALERDKLKFKEELRLVKEAEEERTRSKRGGST